MFDQKWLREYRFLNQYYLVAIDVTGVDSFDHKHCEYCLTKTACSGRRFVRKRNTEPDGESDINLSSSNLG
jgi:hypothetical protein